MSAPEENFEIAVDESNGDEAREEAIGTLQTANECAKLADLVRMDNLDERYREQALTSLAHPQCRSTLETLLDGESLPESLRERAEALFEDTPDDAGDSGRR